MSDSNVAVTVGMMSPATVAICVMQGSGVGLDVCFNRSEGKGGSSGKEENKLLHDSACWQRLFTAPAGSPALESQGQTQTSCLFTAGAFPVNQVLAHGSGVSDPFCLCSQLSLKGSDFWRLDWMLAESW